jgi:hypothetical protein
MEDQAESQQRPGSNGLVPVILSMLVLVGLMLAYWYCPFPSGKRPDIIGFVVFWLRELVALALAVLVLVIIVTATIVKQVRERRRRQAGVP